MSNCINTTYTNVSIDELLTTPLYIIW